MNKAAASKVGLSLVARKLMREIKAKPDMPVWREDEDARSYSLAIKAAGRKAIGVEDEAQAGDAKPAKRRNETKADVSKSAPVRETRKTETAIDTTDQGVAFRDGSKPLRHLLDRAGQERAAGESAGCPQRRNRSHRFAVDRRATKRSGGKFTAPTLPLV